MARPLPTALFTAAQVRELDRAAIETFNIPGGTLMERAGQAAFDVLRERWSSARRVAVVCGPGNNGGDGFVLARLAREAGLSARVLQVGDFERLKGYALGAAQRFQSPGGVIEAFDAEALAGSDVVVDALLGTGIEREVEGEFREAITAVNAARAPVLALDVPSGLHADSGRVMGAAVRASATVTFIGVKVGLLTGEGPDYAGAVSFSELGVPFAVYRAVAPAATRIDAAEVAARLRPRPRTAHKGHHGHVLIVGGDTGMPGAVRLAGEAAARAGAGLVTLATRAAHAGALAAARPELMAHGVEHAGHLRPLLERASVAALGPGLGRSSWARAVFGTLLEAGPPLVIDADGLNLLADEPGRRDDWVLTPHPGEAARLLGCEVGEIQSDRLAAARAIAERYGGVCVLKGPGTVVHTAGDGAWLCDRGNPGMAAGGMGDVLTGVVAGLCAQGMAAAEAARVGVFVHAAAGDAAARSGERGLMAGDVLAALRPWLNPLDS